jgi:flagellar hook-associated protein 2
MATSSLTSIGLAANPSAAPSLAVSGLASGMNWTSIVQELGQAERAPETQWQNQQSTIGAQNASYATITTDLTTLQTDAQTLVDPSFFKSVVASSSAPTVATANAASGTPAGTYTFNIQTLATASQMIGSSNVSQKLVPSGDPSTVTVGAAGFSTPVTAGTFTVNGAQVTVATTDSLQTVFNNISTATSGKVTASYNATTDEISLASSDGSPIILGSSADTSNFLKAAQLNANNSATITSSNALGHLNMSAVLNASDTQTAITDGGSGAGAFKINGVTVNYDASTDTLQDVINNINASAAGVTAAYDPINNRFTLSNSSTGNVGISMQDVTGNFLAATGLSGGSLSLGSNCTYNLNGSSQLINSQSNTIDAASSGITGLTVQALAATTGSTAPVTVTISSDTNTISTAIQKFVTDYNSAQSFIKSQQTVTTAADGTVTPGTLTGDTNANDIITSLRGLVSAVANITGTSGNVNQLSDLGFQSNGNDNTIALSSSTTLSSLLTSNLSDVAALFSDPTNGLATQMNNYITATIGANGTLPTRTSDLTQESATITTQISNLENKITNDTNQWNSEFQNMETAEAQTNSELTYLSQGVANGSL